MPTITTFQRGRVRTPTILQRETAECGPAALGMVLAHYGRWAPLEELRVRCGLSRVSTTTEEIVHAAQVYGLIARGHRVEADKVRYKPAPSIICWNHKHFLVLEGSKGDQVFLNDPSQGPRIVSIAEFNVLFTGLVIELAPGPDFEPGGSPPNRPNRLGNLRSRLAGVGRGIGVAVLAAF